MASGMAYDPRAKFVNIPGLSTKQAVQMLEPYAQQLQEKNMFVKDVVDQIGGNPAWLIRVIKNENPQAVIDKAMKVQAPLLAHPEYTGALQKLVLKGYEIGDEGISRHEFSRLLAEEFNKLLAAGSSSWWWKNEPGSLWKI